MQQSSVFLLFRPARPLRSHPDGHSQSALTSPALPHSGQRRSSRAPPWTSASGGSANRPLSGWREELHHRTANPGGGRRKWCHRPQILGNQNKRRVRAGPAARGGAPVERWVFVWHASVCALWSHVFVQLHNVRKCWLDKETQKGKDKTWLIMSRTFLNHDFMIHFKQRGFHSFKITK